MWTDEMAREKAAREIRVTVAPDQVEVMRVYVVAPSDTTPQSFSFALKATDAEGGGDTSEARFDAPEE